MEHEKRELIHTNKKFMALFYDKCDLIRKKYYSGKWDAALLGEILIAAINYEFYGEITDFDHDGADTIYSTICTDIDITSAKANRRSDTNRKNASAKKRDLSADMTPEEIDADIERLTAAGKL